jgi:transcriptional regulator of acetoin/glycerol metabolism
VMEKKMIIDALEQNQWNRQRAARQLGINIRSFYRKLKKYDIIQTS